MRALLALLFMLLTGCSCLFHREVNVNRQCPPSHCESSCKCQPTDQQCTPEEG